MNGIGSTLRNRYYVVNLETVTDIFAAVCAMIIVVFEHAYSLLWGQGVLDRTHASTPFGVGTQDVVFIPLVTSGAHLATVFYRFICNSASLAWSRVLRSWFVVAIAGNSFVARATHFLHEAPVARFAGPANNAWAFVLLARILKSTFSPLRFAIAVVTHVFLVVSGWFFVSAVGAGSRKSYRWHVNPFMGDVSSSVCAHSIAPLTMNVKFELEV